MAILDLIKNSEDSQNFVLLNQLSLAREWFWESVIESKDKNLKVTQIRIKNVICEKCKKILTDDFDCSCTLEISELEAGRGRKQCKNCQKYVGPRTLVCGYCGFNFKTSEIEKVFKKRETVKKATRNTKKKKAIWISVGEVKNLDILIKNDMVEENIMLFRKKSFLTEEQNSAIESYIEWRNELWNNNKALAIGMARDIHNSMIRKKSVSFIKCEDLEQAGEIGLYKGIIHFDCTRTYKNKITGKDELVKFSTYVTEWIRREIREEILTKDKEIKIPHHIINRYKSFRSYYLDYLEKCGTEPELENIVTDLKVSDKVALGLMVLKDMRQSQPLSVEVTIDKYKNDSGEDTRISKSDSELITKLSKNIENDFEFDFVKYIDELDFGNDKYKSMFMDYFGFNDEQKQYTLDQLQQKYLVTKQTINNKINWGLENLRDVFIN